MTDLLSEKQLDAKALGIPEAEHDLIVRLLRDDMLTILWRRPSDPALRGRIEQAYKLWHPDKEFVDSGEPIAPTLVMGAPGRGNCSLFRLASKDVAEATGLRYLSNEHIDAAIAAGGVKDTDFVFVTMDSEKTAESLSVGAVGLSFQGEDGTEASLGRTGGTNADRLRDRIRALNVAAGGCVLLDGTMGAEKVIPFIESSLAGGGSAKNQTLDGVHLGMAGVVPAAKEDGVAAVRPAASALLNHFKIYHNTGGVGSKIQDRRSGTAVYLTRNPPIKLQ